METETEIGGQTNGFPGKIPIQFSFSSQKVAAACHEPEALHCIIQLTWSTGLAVQNEYIPHHDQMMKPHLKGIHHFSL